MTSEGRATVEPPAPAAPRGARPGRWFWLKAAASSALIGFILFNADLGAVWDALREVRPEWLIATVATQTVGPALIATRWQGLLAVHDVRPGWAYLFRSTLISTFFRQFLPSIVGGDVIRGHDAWRAGASPDIAVMSLVLDRLCGLVALAVLALTALVAIDELAERLPALRFWIAGGLAALIVLLYALVRGGADGATASPRDRLPGPLRRPVARIGAALALYRSRRDVLWRALGLSMLLQINVVTFYWTLAMALGLPIGYLTFYAIAPVAIFVMMLPISINGIGVREGVFIFLLGRWGVSEAEALAFSWLEYGLFLAFGLLGGLIYAMRRS